MRVDSSVGIGVFSTIMTIVDKSPGLNGKAARCWEANRAQVVDCDVPSSGLEVDTSQGTDLVGSNSRINVHDAVTSASRGCPCACHVEIVVFVDLVFAVRVVSCYTAGIVVGLAQQTCHEIVQLTATEPVSTETEVVVALKTRNPPSGTRSDLLVESGVLVDIDWLRWCVVFRAKSGKVRLTDSDITWLIVPCVLIRHNIILYNILQPCRPPAVRGRWCAR